MAVSSGAGVMGILDQLEARLCPVCGADAARATLFLEASIDPSRLTANSFASRKTPEFMSYRLLRCGDCDLVYAVAAPPAAALASAYHEADYSSSAEATLAADTYAAALAPIIAGLARRDHALEIGTGTGVLLGRLRAAGIAEVVGIEPSRAAITAAAPELRGLIREGVFVEDDFMPESFDLICCFQTLEHVADPRALVLSCVRLLRPGGALALVTHDYAAPLNRLLGRRSPIIDIEHLQLFSTPSLIRLLTDAGLQADAPRSFSNRYPLRYWMQLTPLPGGIKRAITSIFTLLRIERMQLSVNVGNLFVVGHKLDRSA